MARSSPGVQVQVGVLHSRGEAGQEERQRGDATAKLVGLDAGPRGV